MNTSTILKGLQAERKQAVAEVARIDAAIAAISKLSGSSVATKAAAVKTHTMSQKGRKAVAAAQVKRWAAFHAAKVATAAVVVTPVV